MFLLTLFFGVDMNIKILKSLASLMIAGTVCFSPLAAHAFLGSPAYIVHLYMKAGVVSYSEGALAGPVKYLRCIFLDIAPANCS